MVGAGIAGLSSAVALQRRGHSVSVLEERADTSSGAGISIWPNALAALDRIGLGDEVRRAGGRSAQERCAGMTALVATSLAGAHGHRTRRTTRGRPPGGITRHPDRCAVPGTVSTGWPRPTWSAPADRFGSGCRIHQHGRPTPSSARTARIPRSHATSTARFATATPAIRPGGASPNTRWMPTWPGKRWARVSRSGMSRSARATRTGSPPSGSPRAGGPRPANWPTCGLGSPDGRNRFRRSSPPRRVRRAAQ